jgi:hypothetical protein
MPYGYINQLPPPPPPKGKAERKRYAKKVGLIAGGIGFFAAFLGGTNNASYDAGYAFVDGLVGGAFWFGVAYGITHLSQRVKGTK